MFAGYYSEEHKRAYLYLLAALTILALFCYFVAKFVVLGAISRGISPGIAVGLLCGVYIALSPFIAYYIASYLGLSDDEVFVRMLQRRAVIIAALKSVIISIAVLI